MQLNKKPIVCAVSLALVACLSSGCAAEWEQFEADVQAVESEANAAIERDNQIRCEPFEKVAICVNSGVDYWRDIHTDVMYMIYTGGYKGGLTVMLHPDGTPLLYSEWLEMRGES